MSLLEGMAGARAGGGTDAGVKQMQTKKSFHARLYYVSLFGDGECSSYGRSCGEDEGQER